MLYKVVLNGVVIDVAASPLQVCKYVERSHMVLRCNEDEDPSGYISERTGQYYQVDGWTEFPSGTESGGQVTLIEIDTDTYDALIDELNAGEEIIDPDDIEPDEPDTPGKTRMQLLEEQVASLQESNDMLTECILEMSELVYG